MNTTRNKEVITYNLNSVTIDIITLQLVGDS